MENNKTNNKKVYVTFFGSIIIEYNGINECAKSFGMYYRDLKTWIRTSEQEGDMFIEVSYKKPDVKPNECVFVKYADYQDISIIIKKFALCLLSKETKYTDYELSNDEPLVYNIIDDTKRER